MFLRHWRNERHQLYFAPPRPGIVVALFAEAGTFAALLLVLKYSACPANRSRVDLPLSAAQMGRWCSLPPYPLAPNLFVPIAIIAYLYLSLTYAGYPYRVRLLVLKKYRGTS